MTFNFNSVKVPITYERLWDNRPKRTIDEHIEIIRELRVDMIFRANWRWSPMLNTCNDQICFDSGYTRDQQIQIISAIKQEFPNIIINTAIPAQHINEIELNEITNQVFNQTQTWTMALDPAKWSIISPTKDEFQTQFSGSQQGYTGYFPDITNPDYQNLLLSWAQNQILTGCDSIWVDLLYTQAGLLYKITGDIYHPAVEESYNSATSVVNKIRSLGVSVGTWTVSMNYPYQKPILDFVTDSPASTEIQNGIDTETWIKKRTDVNSVFGNIPYFIFIDWGYLNSPLETFVNLDENSQISFLENASSFFNSNGMKFVYPIHGGYVSGSEWYDADILGIYDDILKIVIGNTTDTSSNTGLIIVGVIGLLTYFLLKKKGG